MAVVILSGSDEPRDRKRASDLGANGYLVEPAEATTLSEFVLAAMAGGDA